MIARSRGMACLALVLASGAHLGGVIRWDVTAEVEIAGGAASSVQASLGDAFADLAAGTLVPVDARETPVVPKPPDTKQPVETTHETEQVDATGHVARLSVPTEPTPTRAPRAVTAARAPVAMLPVITPPVATQAPARPPSPTAPKPRHATSVMSATEPAETLKADEPDSSDARDVARPRVRPATIQAQARKDRQQIAAVAKQAGAAPAGNHATTDARAGQADGVETTPRGRSTAGKTARAETGGAAASNYPGEIVQKIRRVRRPRIGDRGTAVITFRVADNGGLGAVSVSQSSGSSRLDQAAVQVIERAAPFPAPPAGAQRRFQIEITGR